MVTLTPPQIRGLKLAKDGDLSLQASKKWTHRNARLPFAKADCFQERPIKIKFVTTATVGELRASGLLKTLDPVADPDIAPHGITMAAKMWLLKHK
ncbi:hypothetical protein ATY76_19885 [Rhizobium sp. R339]|uniref:hypothetical protein n=1 Tax=Rhizobium sp. R339 TaxID=1764273 RepID=UPI000B70306C|nr:hypothetical protein [Rhizobium sp. R339]OWV65545.1 hypothetical protein ATY76_19885 [Rhizobium sp. R339]